MKWLTLSCLLIVGAAIAQEPAAEPRRKRPPLTDEQKAQLVERADETWSKLPPEAKIQVMRLHTALTQMPPDERRFIHDRVKRFLDMSPDERQRLRDNAEVWNKMSPEEREQARQKFRQRRQEFEEKWRQEHPGEEPPPFPSRGKRPPRTENPPKENP